MTQKRKIFLALLIILLMTIVGIKIFTASLQKNLNQLKDIPIKRIELTKIPDGVYIGNYEAFPVSAQVKVTVSSRKIVDIVIEKHFNGQGKPAEIITDSVVKAQSLDVDIVSGATYSSKVLLKAIENALDKAAQ